MKLSTKFAVAFSLVLTLLGIAYAQVAKPPQPPVQSSANGRYQIVMSPLSGKNTFLVDTQTGRVWQLTQFTDLQDDPTAWLIQPRIDSNQEMAQFAQTHPATKQP